MARTAQCPSCGASVTFRSGVSVLAVCEYCRTTLLDADGKIENLGKMAELAQDQSRLQIGAQGVYRQQPFAVVGRIQLQYEQGLWNEWFLLFDDQRTGWLSEAAGEYAVSFQKPLNTAVPAFSNLRLGTRARVGDAEWTITDVERATCVAGQGELPFRVGGGYPAPVADLRPAAGNGFITLDYSEDEKTPLLFVGETVNFSDLKCSNLRDINAIPSGPRVQAKALLCGNCGGTLEIRHEGIVSAVCAHCGSIVDAETGKLIEEINLADTRKVKPLIPIGSIGIFRGIKWEAIGFMQRYMISEGKRYYWREYLLAHADSPGYRFLVEYDGHWSVADVLETIPKMPNPETSYFAYNGQTFRHFQSYEGVVDYVIGEFTWLVKIKDTAKLVDYVSPPFMLTLEGTANEISWSLAEYIPQQEIATAFKLKYLMPPIGVYANQPNPLKGKIGSAWRLFVALAVLAFIVQIMLSGGKEIAQWKADLPVGSDPVLLAPFDLAKTANLELQAHVRGLDNEWLELGLALVRESDGETRYDSVEVSYYSGRDEDGFWSENGLDHDLIFRNVPPGIWRVLVDGVESSWSGANADKARTSQPTRNIPVSVSVRPYRAPWVNFFIFLGVLAIWPIVFTVRFYGFESARWAESDSLEEDDD
ncbi:MAG: DUF4178 domain-containing protein [Betaproteobacteria bacterium]|nr:DUF4178 domain-containing protein [Betaproteobacteria bacterium]